MRRGRYESRSARLSLWELCDTLISRIKSRRCRAQLTGSEVNGALRSPLSAYRGWPKKTKAYRTTHVRIQLRCGNPMRVIWFWRGHAPLLPRAMVVVPIMLVGCEVWTIAQSTTCVKAPSRAIPHTRISRYVIFVSGISGFGKCFPTDKGLVFPEFAVSLDGAL